MRILYVCHRFPYPPKRGGKIRPFNMIRHLSQQHEVTVCSLARSAQEADQQAGRVAQPALLPPAPDVVHRRHHRAGAVALDRLVQATGGEAEPVRPFSRLDLAVSELVKGEAGEVGLRRLLGPDRPESVRPLNGV